MRDAAQTGAIGIASALRGAVPDPHDPATILLLVGLGALIGTAVGQIQRLSRERTREVAENWSLLGGTIGASLYIGALLATVGVAVHFKIGLLRATVATLALIVGLVGRHAAKRHDKERRGNRRTKHARKGGKPSIVAHYKDAQGLWHEVVVRKPRDGRWEVVDIRAGRTTLVRTMSGDEGRPEVEAVAREYGWEKRDSRETVSSTSTARV